MSEPAYKKYRGRAPAVPAKPRTRSRQPSPKPEDGECPSGYRSVKGYTRKDGTEVGPSCRRGTPSSSSVRLRGKKGELSLSGYSTKKGPEERYQALDKAADLHGTLPAFRHLNLRATQNKKNLPVYEVMKSDMNYLSLRLRLRDQFGFWLDRSFEQNIQAFQDMLDAFDGHEQKAIQLVNELLDYYPDDEELEEELNAVMDEVLGPD